MIYLHTSSEVQGPGLGVLCDLHASRITEIIIVMIRRLRYLKRVHILETNNQSHEHLF